MEHDDKAADVLRRVLKDGVRAVEPGPVDPWVEVAADRVDEAAMVLRNDPALRFDFLNDLCVVDWFATDKKLEKAVGEPRLVVVYHLTSLARHKRLCLKATLPRWKPGTPNEPPEAPSVAHVWATAEWHEREAYDLSGVRFVGHPNLARILCPDDWVGHPLRKDYQMPLEYDGIRGR